MSDLQLLPAQEEKGAEPESVPVRDTNSNTEVMNIKNLFLFLVFLPHCESTQELALVAQRGFVFLSWSNPRQQPNPTQLLAHSHEQHQGENWKGKNILLG